MKDSVPETCFRAGCTLDDCTLCEVTLCNAKFEGITMFAANFSRANLSGCEFYMVLGMDSIFDNSILKHAKFFGGSFKDASFKGADLTSTTFLPDNIGGAVDLSGADFTDANLDQVIFEKAFYNDLTKFPVDFLPVASGLQRID